MTVYEFARGCGRGRIKAAILHVRYKVENWKRERVSRNCNHKDWSFREHGRCCWKCGGFMVDFGD